MISKIARQGVRVCSLLALSILLDIPGIVAGLGWSPPGRSLARLNEIIPAHVDGLYLTLGHDDLGYCFQLENRTQPVTLGDE
jgi:hypothetical protein